MELLTYLSNEQHDPLTICNSTDKAEALILTENYPKSRWGLATPGEVDRILSEQNVTINLHQLCLTPENFTKLEPLKSFWDVLSTNYDDNGIEFISMFEAKHHPFWGVQYHPEKNAFEWTEKYLNIPHTRDAVFATAFHAEFFVGVSRKVHSNSAFYVQYKVILFVISFYNLMCIPASYCRRLGKTPTPSHLAR